jgi:hypothetical protein
VCVVWRVRSSPILPVDSDDVPDVLDESLLNFLRSVRARSRKTMIAICAGEERDVLINDRHRHDVRQESCYIITLFIRGRCPPC